MRNFLVYEEGDPEPVKVAASTARSACESRAESIWSESAGECGIEIYLFCEGTVYNVEVEFEPVFHSVDMSPIEPGELPAHQCPADDHCISCLTHKSKARRFEDRKKKVEEFQKMIEEGDK